MSNPVSNLPSCSSLDFIVQNKYCIFAYVIIGLLVLYILLSLIKKRDFTLSLPAIIVCALGLSSGSYFTVFSFLILKGGDKHLSKYAPGELYIFAIAMGFVVFSFQAKRYFEEIKKLFS